MGSNVYVKRKPFDNELKHYKYIKRIQSPNGGYRYFYTEAEWEAYNRSFLDKAKLKAEEVIGMDKEKAYNTMKNTVQMHGSMSNTIAKTMKEVRTGTNGWKDYPYKKGFTERLRKDWLMPESKSYQSARLVRDQVLKEYKETPIYKIRNIETKINEGKKKVKEIFNKIFYV